MWNKEEEPMAFGVLAGQITVIFLEVLLGYVGARSGIIKVKNHTL